MNATEVEKQVAILETTMKSFIKDASKGTNKAAARRARKCSMGIQRLLKNYRAYSLK